LWDERELSIDDLSVKFGIYNYESFRRCLGHGEQEVISDFLSIINEEDIVWDVGANQGTYSLFAACKGAEAIAFEPNPNACEIISANADRNDVNVQIEQYALGAKHDEVVLRRAERSGIRWLDDSGEGEIVEVRPGEDISLPEPTVLKIDVEGGELDVIAGLGATLADVRVCYVEWHNDNYEKLREELASVGFELEDVAGNIIKGVNRESNTS
jgi:FkbM family methyltransferase